MVVPVPAETASLTISSWLKEMLPPDFRFIGLFPDPLSGFIVLTGGAVLLLTLFIAVTITMQQTVGSLFNPILPPVGATNSFTASLLPTDSIGAATVETLTIPISNPLDFILNNLPMPFVPVPGPTGVTQALNLASPNIIGQILNTQLLGQQNPNFLPKPDMPLPMKAGFVPSGSKGTLPYKDKEHYR